MKPTNLADNTTLSRYVKMKYIRRSVNVGICWYNIQEGINILTISKWRMSILSQTINTLNKEMCWFALDYNESKRCLFINGTERAYGYALQYFNRWRCL